MFIHFYYNSALMRVIDDDVTPVNGINKRDKEEREV